MNCVSGWDPTDWSLIPIRPSSDCCLHHRIWHAVALSLYQLSVDITSAFWLKPESTAAHLKCLSNLLLSTSTAANRTPITAARYAKHTTTCVCHLPAWLLQLLIWRYAGWWHTMATVGSKCCCIPIWWHAEIWQSSTFSTWRSALTTSQRIYKFKDCVTHVQGSKWTDSWLCHIYWT